MRISSLLILALSALSACTGCSRETNTTPSAQSRSETKGPSKQRFTTIRVDVRTQGLEIFLHDAMGNTFNNFDRLADWLTGQDQQLLFAMNAGMFHSDLSPVGLLVQQGHEVSPLNVSDGTGNFFLKPNGVFFVSESGADIVESTEYPALAHGVRLATQSGPLLVHNGKIHPAFNAASTSRLIRNGVGITGDTVIFVISEEPVNFHEFATFFRDELHCPNALYLDGVVSSLYSVELQRNDFRVNLGPILGIVR